MSVPWRLLRRLAIPTTSVSGCARYATVAQDVHGLKPESTNHVATTPNPWDEALVNRPQYWKKVPRWKDVTTDQFLRHKFQMANSIQSENALCDFLTDILPAKIPPQNDMAPHLRMTNIENPEQFISRLKEGIRRAPMAVRLSPHVLSSINWEDPVNDPIRRQFIPLSSHLSIDHPMAELDPMKESTYSPVPGLIHRYPDRALFLANSVCPVYCRFCFRSYTVGNETESVKKQKFLPLIKKWEPRFDYIEKTLSLRDVVVSGGDTYLLEPDQLKYIGERLLAIPHIRRFRFATKGLSVSPSRLLDPEDGWLKTVIELEKKARKLGKHICIHTHFNSVNEISWITRLGAQRLHQAGVTVRNQTVLLNGVNNTPEKMCALVHALADINIQPYYVFQGDIVPGAEDLRTPMSDSLDLERAVRGQIAGFLVPSFIVDLPGEGGKRLTRGVESYDRRLGLSKLTAPGLKGEPAQMDYWDPLWSLPEEGKAEVLRRFGKVEVDGMSVDIAS